jgi:SnoaL-like domain
MAKVHFLDHARHPPGGPRLSPIEPHATDVFTTLLHAVDTLDWDTVRRCIATEIATDYTSLWGGEPQTLTVDQLLAWWQPFATGFDATQHLTGPIAVVEADEPHAIAVTTVRAYHHIAQDAGPVGTWMVAGHYEVSLDRGSDGWKVGGITLTVAYEDGDRALVDVARRRGETHGGGRFG